VRLTLRGARLGTGSDNAIKVGLIGAGGMGLRHAEELGRIADASVTCVFDPNTLVAQQAAKIDGAAIASSAEEVINSPQVDVVDICSPTPTHKGYAVAAARAGKDIICEKPMARSVEDCLAMIEAAESAGVKLCIGQILRFFPEFVKGHEMIERGAIGTPAVARTSRAGVFPRGASDWFCDFEQSGGVVLDMLVHDFDWHRWCFGDVERVHAKGLAYRGLDHTDYALVTLRFRSGVVSHIEGSWAHFDRFRVSVEVSGDRGLIEFDNSKTVALSFVYKGAGEEAPTCEVPYTPLLEGPCLAELRHFIDCIRQDTVCRVSPMDGLRAVEIALAALESIRTGRVIEIERRRLAAG
jgi:UDP-N-acetylglucosamine 3-dehydrogenase